MGDKTHKQTSTAAGADRQIATRPLRLLVVDDEPAVALSRATAWSWRPPPTGTRPSSW